ncbi:uncharacterized protein EV422DRAFT_520268 [Fimicolochytrium jonesii]|uniref:uncharacterized protein n=1 Tax=Fimicolochytrium jonesii TaxID=1396493 RepID=UPI0022FE6B46|nr:uncharacterized protein EV422DRAFT_520268 [Fimicolochytrium jonesii]KAI8824486.1 hypothetical protein EV422DRAFT_520268 [Fimicolochytrium jonesii]
MTTAGPLSSTSTSTFRTSPLATTTPRARVRRSLPATANLSLAPLTPPPSVTVMTDPNRDEIPFSRHRHRSTCDACKLRAERIAEAKAKVQTIQAERQQQLKLVVTARSPQKRAGAFDVSVTPPVTRTRSRSFTSVAAKVDSGLRSPVSSSPRGSKSRPRSVADVPFTVAADAELSAAGHVAAAAEPAGTDLHGPRVLTPDAQASVSVLKEEEGKSLLPSPAQSPSTEHLPYADVKGSESAVSACDVHIEGAAVSIPMSIILPVVEDAKITVVEGPTPAGSVRDVDTAEGQMGVPESPAVQPPASAIVISQILPIAEGAEHSIFMTEDEKTATIIDCHHPIPLSAIAVSDGDSIESPTTVQAALDTANNNQEAHVKESNNTASNPSPQPTPRPPRRPRVDITNLTAVSTHFQTASTTLLSLQSRTTTPTHLKSAYITTAEHLTHLARELCVSYRPPADACTDPVLRKQLTTDLEQVEVLAVQLGAVTRRVKASEVADCDGVAVCARNLVGRCLRAVDALKAVGIRL